MLDSKNTKLFLDNDYLLSNFNSIKKRVQSKEEFDPIKIHKLDENEWSKHNLIGHYFTYFSTILKGRESPFRLS